MAEFLVTTIADEDNGDTNGMSLREAIQLANANGNAGTEDIITFASDLAGGTITLALGSLVISEDLRIDGDVLGDTTGKASGRSDDITITTATIENFASQILVTPNGYTSPGQVSLEKAVGTFGDFRIFEIREDGTEAAFNALTLTGAGVYQFDRNPLLPAYGASGAAIFQADVESGITRALPDDSGYPFTWDEGSGDLVTNIKTTVSVTNSEISDNFGGAIVAGHRFTMEDSILSANHGGFAAGIMITAVDGEVTIRDSHIVDHDLISARATLGTGVPGGDFIIEDSLISNNRMVDTNVGGALVSTGAGVFFSGSPGGGISISDSVVSNNQGILAGAIATGSPDQDITILNTVMENNIARSDWLAGFGGGAISLAAIGADVYIEGSSLIGNKNVANGGGAVGIGGTSNIFEIVNSTLTGNISGNGGGAIGYQGTSNKTSLISSTVVGNHIVEAPISDLNGLTPVRENILADIIVQNEGFGTAGGLLNFVSYERFAFNGGDNQTRIHNSIIAGNTNLGDPSDVHFQLGLGYVIDFLTDNGFRYHPETGLKILDPEPELPPVIEEYDIAIKNSLIGAGIQANDDDINQDGIPDSLSDVIDPTTNIIGTQDAPIDPMLAAATVADNGQTVLTPLLDSPVIDAGDNALLEGTNTAPQGTVDGKLVNDIAGFQRVADGDGEGDPLVDIGAVEVVGPLSDAVYYVGGSWSYNSYGQWGDAGRSWGQQSHDYYGNTGRCWGRDGCDDCRDAGGSWWHGSRDTDGNAGRYWGWEAQDIYRQTEDGVSLFFDTSDVLPRAQIDGLDVIAPDEILLSFSERTFIQGLGCVDDSDIVLLKATSLGENTAGSFQMYFDGSDVGLCSSDDDVDGFSLLDDGSLLLSTTGHAFVDGVGYFSSEDILQFMPTSLGQSTKGSFEMYFDGSDVGLGYSSNWPNVDAVTPLGDGKLLLSTTNSFYLDPLFAAGNELFTFDPTSLGPKTDGVFSDVDGTIFSQVSSGWNLAAVDFDAFQHDLLG